MWSTRPASRPRQAMLQTMDTDPQGAGTNPLPLDSEMNTPNQVKILFKKIEKVRNLLREKISYTQCYYFITF